MGDYCNVALNALKILSAEASDQLSYLDRIGGASIDELALEFEELMLLAPSKLESGEITRQQYLSLKSIDKELDGLGYECWSELAIRNSHEWKKIRALAEKSLELFSSS